MASRIPSYYSPFYYTRLHEKPNPIEDEIKRCQNEIVPRIKSLLEGDPIQEVILPCQQAEILKQLSALDNFIQDYHVAKNSSWEKDRAQKVKSQSEECGRILSHLEAAQKASLQLSIADSMTPLLKGPLHYLLGQLLSFSMNVDTFEKSFGNVIECCRLSQWFHDEIVPALAKLEKIKEKLDRKSCFDADKLNSILLIANEWFENLCRDTMFKQDAVKIKKDAEALKKACEAAIAKYEPLSEITYSSYDPFDFYESIMFPKKRFEETHAVEIQEAKKGMQESRDYLKSLREELQKALGLPLCPTTVARLQQAAFEETSYASDLGVQQHLKEIKDTAFILEADIF